MSPKYFCFSVTCKTTPSTDIGGIVVFMERWEALNHITQDFLKLIFILLCKIHCYINVGLSTKLIAALEEKPEATPIILERMGKRLPYYF